jgi:hypothetical protein
MPMNKKHDHILAEIELSLSSTPELGDAFEDFNTQVTVAGSRTTNKQQRPSYRPLIAGFMFTLGLVLVIVSTISSAGMLIIPGILVMMFSSAPVAFASNQAAGPVPSVRGRAMWGLRRRR